MTGDVILSICVSRTISGSDGVERSASRNAHAHAFVQHADIMIEYVMGGIFDLELFKGAVYV